MVEQVGEGRGGWEEGVMGCIAGGWVCVFLFVGSVAWVGYLGRHVRLGLHCIAWIGVVCLYMIAGYHHPHYYISRRPHANYFSFDVNQTENLIWNTLECFTHPSSTVPFPASPVP